MPWYIHSVAGLYNPSCRAGMPDGSWPMAIPEPYTAGRLFAAWWVLTGKAYAFEWPKPGELEKAIGLPTGRARPPGDPSKQHRVPFKGDWAS